MSSPIPTTGVAPWSGPTFYGKQTANGELFDGNGLTAAHRAFPMPVNVRVTNLDNGKSLVVRVNDRGPYAKGRIIDVSRRAELLGFYAHGTARVRVTYLGRGELPGSVAPTTTPRRCWPGHSLRCPGPTVENGIARGAGECR